MAIDDPPYLDEQAGATFRGDAEDADLGQSRKDDRRVARGNSDHPEGDHGLMAA
ncbi:MULTISPECIES: hypothetical protein [Prauserella salsuginis group]|uniref:Uncharacterized protein n=1 Tax=Prauserella salsuginis TaxID=387889 RepID=A0ABW6G0T0_9PSEU|nr:MULTISPECIES: hypothetical protein [Prauserella salsuginis group]